MMEKRGKFFFRTSFLVFYIQLLYLVLAVYHFVFVEHRWCPMRNEFVDVPREQSADFGDIAPPIALDTPQSLWGLHSTHVCADMASCPILALFSGYRNTMASRGVDGACGGDDEALSPHRNASKPFGDDVLSYSPKLSPPVLS